MARATSSLCAGLLLLLVLCLANGVVAFELFCGKENCFEVLGLTRKTGDAVAIKKAYRSLSKDLHPDINKEPDAVTKFQRIVNAHEVLTNEEKRKEYEDFLDHPEKYYWYMLEHMGGSYAEKADTTVVVLGIVTLATVLHYLNMRLNYNSAMKRAKDSFAYKEKVASMVKNGEAASVEDAEAQINLNVVGAKQPEFKDLLPFQMAKLPWVIARAIYRQLRWTVRYRVLKKEMNKEDKIILVQSAFNMTPAAWGDISAEDQEEMIECRVWEPEAREEFLQRKRIEGNQKRRRRVRRI